MNTGLMGTMTIMKAKLIRYENGVSSKIENTTVNFTDKDGKFKFDKSISGCKVTINSVDNSVNIELPKKSEPSDMETLYSGFSSEVTFKRNNKDGKYTLILNKTKEYLINVPKKTFLNELKEGTEKLYADMMDK